MDEVWGGYRTVDLARRMEDAGWSRASFWLRRQAAYDQSRARPHSNGCLIMPGWGGRIGSVVGFVIGCGVVSFVFGSGRIEGWADWLGVLAVTVAFKWAGLASVPRVWLALAGSRGSDGARLEGVRDSVPSRAWALPTTLKQG